MSFFGTCGPRGQVWRPEAMLGTCRLAQRRLDEIEDRYGRETLQAVNDNLLDRAEKRMRAAISALPGGTFHYETTSTTAGREPSRSEFHFASKCAKTASTVISAGTSGR